VSFWFIIPLGSIKAPIQSISYYLNLIYVPSISVSAVKQTTSEVLLIQIKVYNIM